MSTAVSTLPPPTTPPDGAAAGPDVPSDVPSSVPSGVQFGATRRGLRVAWLPAPGPVTARLAFRVGEVDERLPERGLTHLVAHLAHRFTDPASGGARPAEVWHRPCTSALEVAFTASGTEDDVREHLLRVSEGLASLAEVLPEEVAHEAGLLRQESDLRPPSSWDLLRTARHGLRGWGQLAAQELALPSADAAALTAWVERWFTAGNAVLSVTGPQPPGWVLPLLSGTAAPVAAPVVLPLGAPARVDGPSGSVGTSVLAPEGAAARAGWWWLHRLVLEELRLRGLTAADVEVDATAVGGGVLELCLAVHTGTDPAQDALHAVQDATARACSEPVPAEELARWAHDLPAPDPVAELADVARAWLLSGATEPPSTPPAEDLRAQALALHPAEVLDVLRAALGGGLLQVPHDVVPPAGLPLAAPAPGEPLAGATWVPAGGGDARLVVSAEGVCLQHEDGSAASTRWEEAVAVLHRPGRSGGARVVVSATGAALEVDPAAWADGSTAVEVLDAHAPADLVVAAPLDDAPTAPRPSGRVGRALAALRALATTPVGRSRAPREG